MWLVCQPMFDIWASMISDQARAFHQVLVVLTRSGTLAMLTCAWASQPWPRAAASEVVQTLGHSAAIGQNTKAVLALAGLQGRLVDQTVAGSQCGGAGSEMQGFDGSNFVPPLAGMEHFGGQPKSLQWSTCTPGSMLADARPALNVGGKLYFQERLADQVLHPVQRMASLRTQRQRVVVALVSSPGRLRSAACQRHKISMQYPDGDNEPQAAAPLCRELCDLQADVRRMRPAPCQAAPLTGPRRH